MTAASAAPATLPVPTDAVALADLLYDTPVDAAHRQVWPLLLARFGTDRAHVLWFDAATLLEQRCTCTRIVLPAHAQVLPVAGVDHCPVSDQAATVCGLDLPTVSAPSDLRPTSGTPCPVCFGPVR